MLNDYSSSNIGVEQETERIQEESSYEFSTFRGLCFHLDLNSNARLDVDLGHQAFIRSRAESVEQEEHHTILGLLVYHVDVVLFEPLHQGCWIRNLSRHSWKLAHILWIASQLRPGGLHVVLVDLVDILLLKQSLEQDWE